MGKVVEHAAQEGLAQRQGLLGASPLAHVTHDPDHRHDGAARIAEGNQTRVDPHRITVQILPILGHQDLAGAEDLLDGPAVAGGELGREQLALLAADHVRGLAAQGARGDLIDEEHVLLAIDDEHHVGHDLEDRGEPAPARGEKLLNLGDVQHGACRRLS